MGQPAGLVTASAHAAALRAGQGHSPCWVEAADAAAREARPGQRDADPGWRGVCRDGDARVRAGGQGRPRPSSWPGPASAPTSFTATTGRPGASRCCCTSSTATSCRTRGSATPSTTSVIRTPVTSRCSGPPTSAGPTISWTPTGWAMTSATGGPPHRQPGHRIRARPRPPAAVRPPARIPPARRQRHAGRLLLGPPRPGVPGHLSAHPAPVRRMRGRRRASRR